MWQMSDPIIPLVENFIVHIYFFIYNMFVCHHKFRFFFFKAKQRSSNTQKRRVKENTGCKLKTE